MRKFQERENQLELGLAATKGKLVFEYHLEKILTFNFDLDYLSKLNLWKSKTKKEVKS